MKLEDILQIDPWTLPSRGIDELDWLPIVPGIYFMWCGERLFYVGKAGDQGIRNRCSAHEYLPFLKEMKNPRISYLELPSESGRTLLSIEAILIKKHKPLVNKHHQGDLAEQRLDTALRLIREFKKTKMLHPVLEREMGELANRLGAEYAAQSDVVRLAQILSEMEGKSENEALDSTATDKASLIFNAKVIKTSHLYQSCQDVGLIRIPDEDGELYVKDIWEKLKCWYVEQGFLFEERDSEGKPQNRWDEKGRSDRERRRDPLVKGENQVYKGLVRVFPDLKRLRDSTNRILIQGLILEEFDTHNDNANGNGLFEEE